MRSIAIKVVEEAAQIATMEVVVLNINNNINRII